MISVKGCIRGQHFIVTEVCGACPHNIECTHFLKEYRNNRTLFIDNMLAFVKIHPKYKMEVKMAAKKPAVAQSGAKKTYALSLSGRILFIGNEQEITAEMNFSPNKYKTGQVILFPLTGAKEAIYTISIKPLQNMPKADTARMVALDGK
jgi:hypothetical protein